MIVSIHQPAYLPWLGYFDKIRAADLFIYLDTVQFQKQSFQNRNRIRTRDGWIWLTVPVETKGRLYDLPLSDVPINNRVTWRKKHITALRMNYSKAPHFERMMTITEPYLDRSWERLSDLCFDMMQAYCSALEIDTEIVKASALDPVDSRKSDLVLDLCRRCGASTYLSGSQGRDYIDEDSFADAGIDLVYQDYRHPTYVQAYAGFEPYMAVVDLLANEAHPEAIV